MGLFNMAKKPEPPPASSTPVDEVLRMRSSNFTNNQIVQALQRNGYKTHQIFDAMNQADLRSAGPVEGVVPSELAQPPADVPDLPDTNSPNQQEQSYQAPHESRGDDRIEEVAEAIIDEKWEDLMKNINKLLEWKEALENRLAAVEQQCKDISTNFGNLQNSVVGKVSEYDRNIKSVSTDLQAMETVFQKLLPTLTENVNELSRLTKKKSKKG